MTALGAAPSKRKWYKISTLEIVDLAEIFWFAVVSEHGGLSRRTLFDSALEATQGQIDGFFSQLPYKCHQNWVASEGD